jgi:hypothetical protein
MIQHTMRLKRMDVRNLRTFWLVSCIFMFASACWIARDLLTLVYCVWSASIHIFTTTDEVGR